jgi:hypothetical protein
LKEAIERKDLAAAQREADDLAAALVRATDRLQQITKLAQSTNTVPARRDADRNADAVGLR